VYYDESVILRLETFQKVGNPTNIDIPVSVLNSLPCGLFRCDLTEAYNVMPELAELYETAPIPRDQYDQWEIDIKIHMLMPRQWPCIPNWHCDNVPRDANGITDYNLAKRVAAESPPMYLWVSSTPCTQFLSRNITMPYMPENHGDVGKFITKLGLREDLHDDRPLLTTIEPQQWISMNCLTPHRGTLSDKHQWRIFARLTHKSILPTRAQTSVLRRHCQVYLDAAEFTW
jgi:hypothetical protein